MENYIGKRFGRLVVLDECVGDKNLRYFVCKCNCGETITLYKYNVLRGQVVSCGCFKASTTKQYANLCIIKRSKIENSTKYYYCICTCWRVFEASFSDLEGGQITSCGYCDFSNKQKVLEGEYKKAEFGTYVHFAKSLGSYYTELRIGDIKIRRRFDTKAEAIEMQKVYKEIYFNIPNVICAAIDCDNKLNDKISTAKYCSNRCRWREHKRKIYEKRKEHGLCPQCGGDINTPKNDVSYCKTCKEYFKNRYYAQK